MRTPLLCSVSQISQPRKHLESALLRRLPAEQGSRIERSFDREHDFTFIPAFRFPDGLLDGRRESCGGKARRTARVLLAR